MEISGLLLDAGANPNFQFDDGWGSPFKVLTGAIRLGEGMRPSHLQALELVKLLVERGADPYDLQALYNTSIAGDELFWVERLWAHCGARGHCDRWMTIEQDTLGASMGVNTLDYLLGNAVGAYYPKRTAWLLKHGANPNAQQTYQKLRVHTLARLSGFSDLATMLQRAGVEPGVLTGDQAFRAALLSGDEDEVRTLLRENPTLSLDPTHLLAAASFGQANAISLLLSLGATATASDHEGITPLHRAVQSGDMASVDRLIEAGAQIDVVEDHRGGTPLGWSLALGRPRMALWLAPRSRDVRSLASLGFAERLKALIAEEPALANIRSISRHHADRPTPLFCLPNDAAQAVVVAEVLLAGGAHPAVRNGKGVDPAHAARLRGLEDAADLIEEARHGR